MQRLPTQVLSQFQTIAIMPFALRSAETYLRLLSISGNSILSSIYVSQMDPGSSLHIRYWDTTTGSEENEEYEIGSHITVLPSMIGSKGFTTRATFSRVHDKAFCEVTVSGGNVEFGVYVTIVSSFATDLDEALQLEGDTIDLLRHQGLPISIYETSTDTWKFLRGINGRLQVDVPSGIQVTQQVPNAKLWNRSVSLIPGSPVDHIDYTVPSGKLFNWIVGSGVANTWCRWTVMIDGVRYHRSQNSLEFTNVSLSIGTTLQLTEGQRIIVSVENLNPYATNTDAETWLYYRLEDV